MKLQKELKILIRMAVLLAAVLVVLISLIRLTGYLWTSKSEKPSPAVKSFSILIPSGYSVHGIDVSKHQSNIDWKRVATMRSKNIKISFVFIKATEGITRQDQKFKFNWENAGKNALLRGAYHFYYPSRDADLQADNFITKVKLSKGDLPPVVDIEVTNGKSSTEIQKGLQVFLNRLEKHYKVKPIIYANINFYNKHLIGKFENYPLWIAGYFDHERFHNEFETPWIFWQHSETGKVDGIRGNVDFNVFNGSMAKLEKLCLKK